MQRIKDFGKLIKFRVNVIVVLSSIFGYLIGNGGQNIIFGELLGLSFGGFFTTGAAHALNQIYETQFDAIMPRTNDRPLPTGRMSKNEVILYAIIMTIAGAFFFWYFNNTITLSIGMGSLFIYSFIYTPVKRISPIAVVIGAIPGALPPTIGYVAATGSITNLAILLFIVQFVWQFPHFWSIAWIYNDDYTKAGYDLLPTKNGRTIKNAFLTFLSSMILIPTLFVFYIYGHINLFMLVITLLISLWFIVKAYNFYKNPNLKFAKKLMLGSIIYLPILQLLFVIFFWK